MQRYLSTLVLAALAALAIAPATAPAQGTPIGIEEDLALATDRDKALEQLIPGTADYYYFHCRHHQNTGAFAKVSAMLQPWIQRYGRTRRVQEIENRQALLTYRDNTAQTFQFLQRRLGLKFDHQRQVPGEKRDLATNLSPGLLSPAALTRRALRAHPRSVDGFRDAAFDFLVASDLDDDLLMSLLKRVRRPDLPNLPALVARNLGHRQSRGFGSLTIHNNLLLAQLDECIRLKPALLDDNALIAAYVRRLQPNADVQWQRDPAARQAYLDRLQSFAQRLAPAHNSLKAHVLHHRLRHDLAQGQPSKPRLLAYLRLPRRGSYVNPDYLRRTRRGAEIVDLNRTYATGLARIGNDESLVRAYLSYFFAREDSFQPYAETVRADYLRRLFAETKILLGAGDMERWYSMLNDPSYYKALKERVEIEFPPTQRRFFGAAEAVAVDVDIKNVATLLVKVFEINTLNFYRQTGKEVDASINLDGLVANVEKTHKYTDNPLRRVRRRFELPSVARPGTYVVELIGNGISSRAVVHKGRLHYVDREGSAGHVIKVLDDAGNHLKDASIWLGARNYEADEHGEIVVPFSTRPGARSLILRHGRLTSLAPFDHAGESYRLTSHVHVDRESLLAKRKATVLVRPTLLLNGRPVSFDLLESPVLTITSVDGDGVPSILEVRDLKLSLDREIAHEIRVPAGLVSLNVALRGRVRNLSAGKDVDVADAGRQFALNGIEATAQTGSPLLSRTPKGYVLEMRGKDGEPLAGRAVSLQLQHQHYRAPITVTLKTDARGRIGLGQLGRIESVRASGLPNNVSPWLLRASARSYPSRLHGAVGQTLRVPYQGRATELGRSVASLLEVRGGAFVRDAFEHVALRDGFLELRGLPVGDYDLWLKEASVSVQVKVAAGTARGGWVVGGDRLLELGESSPLHVTNAAIAGDQVRVRLANAGADARVHVVATRYLPAFDPFERLRGPGSLPPSWVGVQHAESSYHSGREIGDEYRYILERRFTAKFPGNMLQRPGLILNPWVLDDPWSTAVGLGGGAGGKFGGRRGGRSRKSGSGGSVASGGWGSPAGTFASLEFLPEPALVVANVRPDDNGMVTVPLAKLGGGHLVHVLAVDRVSTVYTTILRDEAELEPRSRRLAQSLDTKKHFAEQRGIEFVGKGGSASLDDVATARAETYDSLASVYRLFSQLSKDAELAKFAFVLEWTSLPVERKQELYSEHACHELHLFLHQKDRTFFDAVVRPYIANKAHKTFLDHWLLEADLRRYLDPWAFARLNVVERILLAQRLSGDGETDAVQRHVGELFDLKPPDLTRLAQLFDSALKGDALGKSSALGAKLERAHKALADRAYDAKPKKKAADKGAAPARRPTARSRRRAEAVADEEVEEEPAEESELLEKAAGEMADDLKSLSKDVARRKSTRALYRAPDKTKQLVERNYWQRRIEEQNADLIKVNSFWRDYAQSRGGEPFFSTGLAEAAGNFAEMMFALSVLDLPFKPGEHKSEVDGSRLTLRAASPLLLVRKELVEVAGAEDAAPILVSQNFFRLNERYRFVGNERLDAFVSDEFLVDVAYGCRVVVTNPTSSPRKLELLLQIPQGALPVQRGFFTRGVAVSLAAYATSSIEYAFYFPRTGTMQHYPVHVARDGKLIAFAAPKTLNVVAELSKVDTTSWQHISQNGSGDEVLAYLDAANLLRTDLAKIAWRMRDPAFFAKVIERLRGRHAYNGVLWSYAIAHGDEATAREYLRHADGLLANCGAYIDSPLVKIDPVERLAYQHIDYEPLFNPRAHRFGKRRVILHKGLARQYKSLLGVLGYRPRLDDADWMSVTYYMLLQDRVEDAMASFARVDPSRLSTRLQYDYMRAYMDFFTESTSVARSIAERYRDHPVKRWRQRFADVRNQLDEAGGQAISMADRANRDRQQGALAKTEPSLELEVESRRVSLRYRNLERCEINYYEMDVEFLFSTHPFVQQGSGSFSFIRPNRSESRSLGADKIELAFDLPAEFQNSNVLVEVRAGGITKRQAYYANSLAVHLAENYGQLEVTHAKTGKPLRTVYVKVFSRGPGGAVRFHKDGYTDLRGRFDYASLSGDGVPSTQRYSILVLSQDHGAVIREVAPPTE